MTHPKPDRPGAYYVKLGPTSRREIVNVFAYAGGLVFERWGMLSIFNVTEDHEWGGRVEPSENQAS